MTDYVLIVDQYRRHQLAREHRRKIDPVQEAAQFSTIAKVLGDQGQLHALVDESDVEGLRGYHSAHFEVRSMNGDRETALGTFITDMNERLDHDPPRDLVVVTDDSAFQFLLGNVANKKQTRIAVWYQGNQVPPGLQSPRFNARRLDQLLPGVKVPRIDIRLDYENLHLGLLDRGWNGSVRAFVQAVRDAFEPIGDVVRIVAYADYGLLKGDDKRDWQRELLEAGVEATYLVNERGKNTADMKIADAVRDLLEGHQGAGDAVDVIGLGTNDRDFKTVIETARQRGKQVKLLAIRGGLSRHLVSAVPEKDVIFIDDFLKLGPKDNPVANRSRVSPFESDTRVLVRIAAWLARQGVRGWRYAPTEQLIAALALDDQDLNQVEKAVAAGKLQRSSRKGQDGPEETLELNQNHPVTKAAQHLVRWAPSRVGYCLNSKGMPFVDSNFLAKGMQMDKLLVELGAGQNRHEAETWLRLLGDAGVLQRREQERPGTPGKVITTWWLPEHKEVAASSPEEPTIADQQPATPADHPEPTSAVQPQPAKPRPWLNFGDAPHLASSWA
jgi:hypothetical protein